MILKSYSKILSLSDPTRLRILSLIHALPGICVCQIIHVLKLPQTTISKALGVLKKESLVRAVREKQWVRYWPKNDDDKEFPLLELLKWASKDAVLVKDIQKLKKTQNISLDKICSDKPWRNSYGK